jgi:hypothetical protein
MLPIKTHKPKEICQFQKKGEKPPRSQVILMRITLPDTAHQRILQSRFQGPILKKIEFCIIFFLARRKNSGCMLICLFFIHRDKLQTEKITGIEGMTALMKQKNI